MKRIVPLLALAALLVLTACQHHIAHSVVATPHPTGAANHHALYFADSQGVGLTKPPYNYHTPDFSLPTASVNVVVTCYGPDQTNYLGAPYQIHVDVYQNATLAQQDLVVAVCKPGNPVSTSGIFTPSGAPNQKYSLTLRTDGPWTIEVDPS